MKVQTLQLGPVQTNCYIIEQPERKEAVLIDPADNAEYIKDYLDKKELVPIAILLTHGHFDHIMAVNELSSYYRVKKYASLQEKEVLENASLNCSNGFLMRSYTVCADEFFQDRDVLSLAGLNFQVLATPGHTIGSVCFYLEEEKIVFSGDTLFESSIGRTDLPTGNEGRLIQSIKEKLLPLDDEVIVFPGHGGKTTIGYERKNNYYIR